MVMINRGKPYWGSLGVCVCVCNLIEHTQNFTCYIIFPQSIQPGKKYRWLVQIFRKHADEVVGGAYVTKDWEIYGKQHLGFWLNLSQNTVRPLFKKHLLNVYCVSNTREIEMNSLPSEVHTPGEVKVGISTGDDGRGLERPPWCDSF